MHQPGPCARASCEKVTIEAPHFALHLHSSQLISSQLFSPNLTSSQLFASHLLSSQMSSKFFSNYFHFIRTQLNLERKAFTHRSLYKYVYRGDDHNIFSVSAFNAKLSPTLAYSKHASSFVMIFHQHQQSSPAAKDNVTTHAAAAPRHLDAAITRRYPLQNGKGACIYAHGNTIWQHSRNDSNAICKSPRL